jgi:hypothetical protein
MLSAGSGMAAEKKADQGMVRTLMSKSGLNKQMEQMPLLLQTGMKEANQETPLLSPEALKEMSGLSVRAFDPARMKETVEKHMQAQLSNNDVREAITWLDSPLGMRIMQLEQKSATPEGYREMLKTADQLVADPARVELIRKLDQAVKATETGVAMVINTQTAIIAALASSIEPEKRPTIEAIGSEVEKSREQIHSQVEAQMVLTLLYSYRGLTDTEIGQYLKFAESDAGKKYHAVAATGLNAALSEAVRSLAMEIEKAGSRMLTDLKKSSPVMR